MATSITNTTGMSGGTNIRGQVAGVNYGHMEFHVSEDRIEQLEADTEKEVKAWTKGMIKVAALETVVQKLEAGIKWITLSGNPGGGKTTLGYMILNRMKQKGKRVFRATTPTDLELLKSNENSVVLLDNIFGACLCNQTKLSEWETSIHQLLELQERTDVVARVILVSRTNVLTVANIALERHSILNPSSLIDCSGKRDIQEKEDILDYYLERKNISITKEVKDKIVETKVPHGFPHCCRIYVETVELRAKHKLDVDIVAFFSSPIEFLNRTTKVLIGIKDYLCLFKEMIAKDGALDITSEDDETKRVQLKEASDQLLNSYVVDHGGCVVFTHHSIYESVAQNVAEKDIRFFIESADLSFLQENLNIKETDEEIVPGYINLELNPRLVSTLAGRFKQLVSLTKFDVYGSQLARSSSFSKELVDQCFQPSKKPSQSDEKICINAQDLVGKTALHYSIEFETYVPVSFLLMKGADVNIQTRIGLTALHYICRAANPNVKIMKLMFENNAEVNIQDRRDRRGPLHWFCCAKHPDNQTVVEAAKMLVDQGADVNMLDKDDLKPLDHLCSSDDPSFEIVKLIIDHEGELSTRDIMADMNRYRWKVRSPLHRLCHAADPKIDIIKLVIEKKGGVDTLDKARWKPLKCLFDSGHPKFEIVKLLIENMVDKNDENDEHRIGTWDLTEALYFYLHRADQPDFEIMKLLIENKANVNREYSSGWTPLYHLCLLEHPDFEIIKLLLEHKAGVNIHVEDEDCQRAPLHLLCGANHPNVDIITLLVNHGADVNILDDMGRTPLHYLCTADVPDIMIMKMLIEHKADVNIQDKRCGRTPIHWLCSTVRPAIEAVKLLAESKAEMNLKDELYGMTPLHCLCHDSNPNIDIISLLTEHKANVNTQDNIGKTALHHLCRAVNPNVETVKLLVEQKADVNLKDKSSRTALEHLSQTAQNYTSIVELLSPNTTD